MNNIMLLMIVSAGIQGIMYGALSGEPEVQYQLRVAIEKGEMELVDKALQNGADINYALHSYSGQTPLMMSIEHPGRPDITQALLDRKADVNRMDDYGHTALMCALETGREADAEVQVLLNNKADVTLRGATFALMCAVVNQASPACIKQLIDLKAAVNTRHADSFETALHMAVAYDLKDSIALLIAEGANVLLGDARGIRARARAEEKGCGLPQAIDDAVKAREESERQKIFAAYDAAGKRSTFESVSSGFEDAEVEKEAAECDENG